MAGRPPAGLSHRKRNSWFRHRQQAVRVVEQQRTNSQTATSLCWFNNTIEITHAFWNGRYGNMSVQNERLNWQIDLEFPLRLHVNAYCREVEFTPVVSADCSSQCQGNVLVTSLPQVLISINNICNRKECATHFINDLKSSRLKSFLFAVAYS